MVSLDENIVAGMVQVIDVASGKGVFVGQDLTTVGKMREVLLETLKESQQQEFPTEEKDSE